ncbi:MULTISPECIES: efflux RND transporter periplasmic adaptor subunit [unclassified Brevundimonas]|uniref:efflux RND transporter periplasmic adaptor subunit n=1 Tax=unclassified Brevundimonas TaxID=2622653 RepID=UPI000CFE2241|nr:MULTISPECIES: efflux RND transporter periplasmic adaptor subunit [unclassified Brevundimonas]PRA21332.1 efflux transporter periplasmic adaptor subunit [Brevundimonas sp. MYb27]PQZ73277.1 efflux transporter periplasmic adaptor subunit [Brevundimonas sp. MYb31]PRB17529.1 efflux transporter periplasmic adaptor subunit [Brevundimonas sp. MYb52]PRB37902.1 efflux transporter periplasmic adaptor subunit [Brevundimonas sp. MYb46]PRB40636.1 efflux transporter periplasmic adaptor subunit [Brevundimon
MFKRHFFIIVAACLVGLMVLAAVLKITLADDSKDGAGGPGRGGPGGGRGQTVAEAVAAPREFADQIRVLGVARSKRSVNITSNTTELITRVMFTDGQRVAAGAPLVELQAREEDADLIQARAQLAQAQREYDRFKILAERGVAPRVTAENAETALQTARAAVAASEARRGDRILRAPFAGVLGLTTVTPGTLISPGSVITTLDDTSAIRVDFPLPERYLGALQIGTPLSAGADAYAGETFDGRIALLDTRVNEQTRAVIARAEFANPGNRIRPGMMMRVAVHQGRRQSLSVPEAAVQYEGQGAFVYRIARGENGTTAQRVEVQTGAVEGGFVEILSGLDNNDRVVASGLNRIQPGAPVTVGGAQQKGGANAAQAARK